MFTQEMIREIEKRLSISGIRDTDIDRVDLINNPLTGKETFVIVKDGENKRISLEELYDDIAQYIAGGPITARMEVSPSVIGVGVSTDVDIKVTVDRVADKITILKDSQVISEAEDTSEISTTDYEVHPSDAGDITYQAVIEVEGRIKRVNATITAVKSIDIKKFTVTPSVIYTGETATVQINAVTSSEATIEIYKVTDTYEELIYGPVTSKNVSCEDTVNNPSVGSITYRVKAKKSGQTYTKDATLAVEDRDVSIKSFSLTREGMPFTNTDIPVKFEAEVSLPSLLTIKDEEGNIIYESSSPLQSISYSTIINKSISGTYKYILTAQNGSKIDTKETSIDIIDVPVVINSFSASPKTISTTGDSTITFEASVSPSSVLKLYQGNTLIYTTTGTNLNYQHAITNPQSGSIPFMLEATNGDEVTTQEVFVNVADTPVAISDFKITDTNGVAITQVFAGINTPVRIKANVSPASTVKLYQGNTEIYNSSGTVTNVNEEYTIVNPSAGDTISFRIVATNGTQTNSDSIGVLAIQDAIAVQTFTLSPNTVITGIKSTVSVAATFSDTASVAELTRAGQAEPVLRWTNVKNVSETFDITPTTNASTTYTLTAYRNNVQGSATAQLTSRTPTLSLTTSPQSVYNGEATTVNFTATASNAPSGVTANEIKITHANDTVIGNVGSNTNSITRSEKITLTAAETFKAQATFTGKDNTSKTINATATVNITNRNYAYIGSGATASEALGSPAVTTDSYTSGSSYDYTIPVNKEGDHIWFILPKNVTIDEVTSNSFPFYITDVDTTTINNMNVYRSLADDGLIAFNWKIRVTYK